VTDRTPSAPPSPEERDESAMPSLAELQALAEDVLDRKSVSYVAAAMHFARFVRDHGSDGPRLAKAIDAIAAARTESERDRLIAVAIALSIGVRR
jgi:hypothetical protein